MHTSYGNTCRQVMGIRADKLWEFIFGLIRHGSIGSVTTISGMEVLCIVSSQ